MFDFNRKILIPILSIDTRNSSVQQNHDSHYHHPPTGLLSARRRNRGKRIFTKCHTFSSIEILQTHKAARAQLRLHLRLG